jgi:Tfp pilus assembly protein FimV
MRRLADAEALLDEIAAGPDDLLAAQARYDLARIALRRGDSAGARVRLDRLLATVQDPSLRTAAEALRARLPE